MPTSQEESVARGHELSTINVRQVGVGLLSLLALIILTFVGMVELMEFYSAENESEEKMVSSQFQNPSPTAVPPLYVNQAAELQQRLTQQRTFLNSFGASDNAQFLRIPITDAIMIFAEQAAEGHSTEEAPHE